METTGFITGLSSELSDEVQKTTKSLESSRKYRFEVIALIENNQLQIRWRYSKKQYQLSTVSQLTQRLINNLKSFIALANQESSQNSNQRNKPSEEKRTATADFAAARVNKAQLNQLMGKLKARGGQS